MVSVFATEMSKASKPSKFSTHVFEILHKVGMLIRDVLLHEGSGLEQLLASLASELSFVFLLDVLLASFTQLPTRGKMRRRINQT